MSERAFPGIPLRSLSAAEALLWIEANAAGDDAAAGELPVSLTVNDIETVEPLLQPRPLAEHHVMAIAGAIKSGRKIDPLLVYAVGGRKLLLDGHHRLAAYRHVSTASAVPVEFFIGTPRDAVLEARARNSATKLPMSPSERHDDAWRLVRMRGYSKADICQAAFVSKGSVDAMRRALKTLGADEAAECKSWRQARARAEGKGGDTNLSDDERQAWIDEMADGWADRLLKTFGTKMANQPEIAAQALASHFGRRLPELTRYLRAHLPEQDESEDDF